MATKAKLYLLPMGFEDPALPGQSFLCSECTLIDGLLGAQPGLLDHIDIERVPFPRPRQPVIAAIGEANQSLPVLVLPEGERNAAATGSANGRQFASGAPAIIAALAERHGTPVVHP